MIQAKGTIKIGIAEYTNPVINVYMASASKFVDTLGIAQIGYINQESEISKKEFIPLAIAGTYLYSNSNPSFEEVDDAVILGLEKDYPSVIFGKSVLLLWQQSH